jgi:hypothetical protein
MEAGVTEGTCGQVAAVLGRKPGIAPGGITPDATPGNPDLGSLTALSTG